jgi:hypothetical protein
MSVIITNDDQYNNANMCRTQYGDYYDRSLLDAFWSDGDNDLVGMCQPQWKESYENIGDGMCLLDSKYTPPLHHQRK